MVTEVVDDSPAAKMGVKLHDLLTELDGKRLTAPWPNWTTLSPIMPLLIVAAPALNTPPPLPGLKKSPLTWLPVIAVTLIAKMPRL